MISGQEPLALAGDPHQRGTSTDCRQAGAYSPAADVRSPPHRPVHITPQERNAHQHLVPAQARPDHLSTRREPRPCRSRLGPRHACPGQHPLFLYGHAVEADLRVHQQQRSEGPRLPDHCELHGQPLLYIQQQRWEDDSWPNGDDYLGGTDFSRYLSAGTSTTIHNYRTLVDGEIGYEEVYQKVRFKVGSGGVWSGYTGWQNSAILSISN